jgi:hypothetical protein
LVKNFCSVCLARLFRLALSCRWFCVVTPMHCYWQ